MSLGKIAAGVFIAGIGLGAAGIFMNVVGTATSIATAPGRVIQKTLQTDNIISSYEWYFDTNAQFNARIGQIATHKQILGETTDDAEKSRLRMEMASMQQSCRELAERYNANSMKMNKTIFKDWRLEPALDPAICL